MCPLATALPSVPSQPHLLITVPVPSHPLLSCCTPLSIPHPHFPPGLSAFPISHHTVSTPSPAPHLTPLHCLVPLIRAWGSMGVPPAPLSCSGHGDCSPHSLPLPAGHLPALRTRDEGIISKPQQIITHLRKQKYNADYDLSATQSADTLAFVSLLEEKLLPVLIHTFWVDAKNYVEHTRKWYAETIPFPLNFFLPNAMHKRHLERLQLIWGDDYMEDEEKLEKELYREARECLTLLSQRLGSQKFFFGDSPASLDALVFSRLAPLLKAKLPNGKLQQHLKSLQNLCNYCTSILSLYFPWDGGDPLTGSPSPWRRRRKRRRSEEDLRGCSSTAPGTDCFYPGSVAAALLRSVSRQEPQLRGSVPATPINLPRSTCALLYSQHPQGRSQFPQLPRLEFCSRHQCALPLTAASGLAGVLK
uniref:Metaxin-1 n=1 Tax=Taeniopygia guttata TaxID=59729 RepID=A0A674HDG5_TAEGU